MIESRLAELSGRSLNRASSVFSGSPSPEAIATSQNITDIIPSPPQPSIPLKASMSYDGLPPPPVLWSLVDTYFVHGHNQPYGYFREASFRQKLESGLLPKCLIFAVLAAGVRFSTHEYFGGNIREASEAYARESWLGVLAEHMTVEGGLNVHVVQAVDLLSVLDNAASRASSTWVKIGLAARISQNLNLTSEPNKWLSYADQEEHRRAFWSTYLVDKLISCGRSRPLAILDEDCNVQLPCDEETFRKGEWKKTYTLDQLLSWDTHVTEPPSPFALTILMASIFGRCTRYVNRKSGVDNVPPWDTNSEFSSLNSSLLLLESYSKIGSRPISVVLLENSRPDGSIDRQQVGHLVFAHTLFHLCYCLLNHPFCLRHRLKRFGRKIPRSFPFRALQVCREHAKQLLDLLIDSTRSGCLVESSFYAYCLAIAGGIHSLIFHFESQNVSSGSSEALKYFQQSMDMLNTLAGIWDHASNIASRLQSFHALSYRFANLLNPDCLTEELEPGSEDIMLSMLDYGVLGTPAHTKVPESAPPVSTMPSTPPWALSTDVVTSPRLGTDSDLFSEIPPGVRINEIEYLLNCAAGGNGIL